MDAMDYCAAIRAFLEDSERKEVIPHNNPEVISRPDNATAPAVAGADPPPWLATQNALVFQERPSKVIGRVVCATEADPPCLHDAAKAMFAAWHGRESIADDAELMAIFEADLDDHLSAARAALRVANAQPVSDAEVDAALTVLTCIMVDPRYSRERIRTALEAAAKVRRQ